MRDRGVVKYFNKEKGYGFIKRDNMPDLFVHFRSIEDNDFKMLEIGQIVEFDIFKSRKGDQADKVKVIK